MKKKNKCEKRNKHLCMFYDNVSYSSYLFIRYLLFLLSFILILSPFFYETLRLLFKFFLYFILKSIVNISYDGSQIVIGNSVISIIKACISPETYVILSFLFFSMPNSVSSTIKCIVESFLYFTLFNFLRILVLCLFYFFYGKLFFEEIHLIFYEFLTGVVVGIFFLYIYKREGFCSYPFVTDCRELLSIDNF